jgi:flagellar L-ring protein precursor FlgH
MTRCARWILGLMLAICVFSPALTSADSIWQRHNFFHSFLYVDNRARRPGDIVTVLITESTDIQHQDQRALARKTDTGGGMTITGNITGTSKGANRTVSSALTPDLNTNRNFTGNSTYNINQTFTDTVACTVIAVQPNGNLVIEGFRQRTVSREVRTLRLCGVIRPIDINFDNTIPSSYVANFQIQYLGRGVETNFSNQGWMSRMMNFFWPF